MQRWERQPLEPKPLALKLLCLPPHGVSCGTCLCSVPSTLHLQDPTATLPLLKLEYPILCLWSVATPSGSSKTPTASNQLHTPLSFLFRKDGLYTSVFPHPCFFHWLHGLEGTSPWQRPSPALRVLLPLIALNFPSISYPFFWLQLQQLSHHVYLLCIPLAPALFFFFFPFTTDSSFLPPPLTPTSNNKNYSLNLRHAVPFPWKPQLHPLPYLPASCYSFSTSQDRHNFPS